MSEYQKNPIGYYMHKDRINGVLVKWEDLRKEGDTILGKPCINLSHERGQRTVDEIESGFLNAASLGHFVVLEISDKAEDYLPGQSGPTLSKWYNRECSLVDIPGNFNALTELFDENDNPIKLENLSALIPKNLNMSKIFFSPEQIMKMNLKADAEQASIDATFNDLIAKAGKVDGLAAQLTVAQTEKATAETELSNFKNAATGKEVKDLCAKGVTDKKITVEVSTKLEKQFAGKPVELKDLIDALPAYQGVVASLNEKDGTDLSKKTWNELDKEGKLSDLKANNVELFKAKYKDQFGKEYAGK